MKLRILSEDVFTYWTRGGTSIRAEPQDDTNCLVAYRIFINNRASSMWAVSLNGQRLGMLVKMDTRFKHDNWQVSFATRYDKDKEDDFVQIMTAENRAYLTDAMKRLSAQINQAVTARQAFAVFPIDPAKIQTTA